MENLNLKEIRNRLSALPVLESRLEKLRIKLCDAEKNEYTLKKKYEEETDDVENLMKESFSTSLLRMVGRYEGKLTKETHEQLGAKVAYDHACELLNDLRTEQRELIQRISELKKDRSAYADALENRKLHILRNVGSEEYNRYMEIDHQLNDLEKQIAETDEAIRAANRVNDTARCALDCLESAQGWATYDVWTRGGILGHVAKYDHIDQAETYLSRIESQLKTLEDELADVNFQGSMCFTFYDTTTRAVDFWFDNIFTDLNVRSMISDNQDLLHDLLHKLETVIEALQSNKDNINCNMHRFESQLEKLLIN